MSKKTKNDGDETSTEGAAPSAPAATEAPTYTVTDRIAVNHNGREYKAGEAIPLTEEQASPLLANGTVTKDPA